MRAFVADVPGEVLAGSPVIRETTLLPLHCGVGDKFLMSPVPGRGGFARRADAAELRLARDPRQSEEVSSMAGLEHSDLMVPSLYAIVGTGGSVGT